MNQFSGKIHAITTSGSLSQVDVMVKDVMFTTVIIDTPDTLPELNEGHAVSVVFNESEVSIGKEPLKLSQQNRLNAVVAEIHESELLAKIKLESSLGGVTALITNRACKTLDLKPNDQVVALIKSNEIMLLYD